MEGVGQGHRDNFEYTKGEPAQVYDENGRRCIFSRRLLPVSRLWLERGRRKSLPFNILSAWYLPNEIVVTIARHRAS